jgi:hypothetical protein
VFGTAAIDQRAYGSAERLARHIAFGDADRDRALLLGVERDGGQQDAGAQGS